MFAIDLLKFRRSYVWAVIFLVPSIAVGIGAANYHANLASLNAGWASYLSQATPVSYTHLTLPTTPYV